MTYDINTQAQWYASYMGDDQGRALVLCQHKRIKQLESLIEAIKGEGGQTEYTAELRLNSITALIDNLPKVKHTEGYFTWEAKDE